ncbi:tyrosine recombinase XerC [Salisediminibacterium selenitireducens]|uniref:Tyrosine recombinase XerC n=1 Tax=Bacillus selenitireducens (strain ATCC 700615 / DSM 15326 / MLS10) TaxID=439292 RepID=D6XTV6_BACIE|nr:tyrosine recombinase XerC [Salisediminibacterium selenitireducens]ADH99242.1 tyrosine recombinase XerC [[Bacillus] selenitireducens MLS10]
MAKRGVRMDAVLERDYMRYLQIEKGASPSTISQYQKDICAFFQNMDHTKPVEDVNHQDIRRYLALLQKDGYARRTVARKLASLRSLWRFLEREGRIQLNPFLYVTTPKLDKKLPSFLYENEMQAIFDAIDTDSLLGARNLAIIELLYASGIRASECTGLKLKDIDLDLSTLLVMGKGKKERFLPVGSFAVEALSLYLDKRTAKFGPHAQSDPLFINYRGGALTDRGLRKILAKVIEDASLTSKLTPHVIRHTFATHMLNEGADLRTVQELLGHTDLKATQIYTHVTRDRLRDVYRHSHPRAKK